jgi:hypothetical protein
MKYSYLITSTLFIAMSLLAPELIAAPKLPGADESSKLEAAGTLLRLVDTLIFVWGARVGAAMCILSAGWSLKEQRFGIALIAILAAVVIATAPAWVKNLFEIGGGSVFS